MKSKFLYVLCRFLFFVSMLSVRLASANGNVSERINAESYSDHPNFISISIIIDKAQDFDDLSSWLSSVNYTKFIFVVYSFPDEGYILRNSTIDVLQKYGEIIPRLPYYQQYNTSEREELIDEELRNYSGVGCSPEGVMDFVPDTYSANYALSKGVEYIQGYCFDQWRIDYITERGGFQMPYYASFTNILVPSATNGGIVVLPHSTWDWVASFTVDHKLQAHVVNLNTLPEPYPNNMTAETYFFSFLDNTLSGSYPFGFFNFQFEWSWTLSSNYTDMAKNWITRLMTEYSNYLVTYEEFVDWFKSNYSTTPEYRINYTSPYNQESIEWYYSNESRVARIGSNVVSYVDYAEQLPDKYLIQNKTINWLGPPDDPNNCIDDSLRLGVDALGGGLNRHKPSTLPIPYTGDLEDFSKYYVNLKDHSLSFDGIDDYVSCNSSVFQTQELTIELWIAPTYTIETGSNSRYGCTYGTLISYTETWVSQGGWTLYFDFSDGHLCFTYRWHGPDQGVNTETVHTNRAVWNSGSWCHIAVTYSPVTFSLAFYVNRTIDRTYTWANTQDLFYENASLKIGGDLTYKYMFQGLIDEVRLWSVSRTQSEISESWDRVLNLTECAKPELISYWRFDEGAESESKDLSLQGNNAILGFTPHNPLWVYYGALIIPEFPSFPILSLIMIAMLVTVIVYRRKQGKERR